MMESLKSLPYMFLRTAQTLAVVFDCNLALKQPPTPPREMRSILSLCGPGPQFPSLKCKGVGPV